MVRNFVSAQLLVTLMEPAATVEMRAMRLATAMAECILNVELVVRWTVEEWLGYRLLECLIEWDVLLMRRLT